MIKDETKKQIEEDGVAPAMSAGSGAVAGIGIGKDGEPGVNKKKRKLDSLIGFIKRKQP